MKWSITFSWLGFIICNLDQSCRAWALDLIPTANSYYSLSDDFHNLVLDAKSSDRDMWLLSAAVTTFVGCWPALGKDEGDSLRGETWERWLSISDLSNISCSGSSIHKLSKSKVHLLNRNKMALQNWQHKPVMVGTRKGVGKQKAAVFIRDQKQRPGQGGPFPTPAPNNPHPQISSEAFWGPSERRNSSFQTHFWEIWTVNTPPKFVFGYTSAPDYSTGLPSRVINGGFCQAPGNNSCL